MQVRRMFDSPNRAVQVAAYLKAAEECDRAGFTDFAAFNREMAAWLTPKPPRVEVKEEDTEEFTNRPRRNRGSDSAEVG